MTKREVDIFECEDLLMLNLVAGDVTEETEGVEVASIFKEPLLGFRGN